MPGGDFAIGGDMKLGQNLSRVTKVIVLLLLTKLLALRLLSALP